MNSVGRREFLNARRAVHIVTTGLYRSVKYVMSVPKVLGLCAQLPLNYAISVYDSAWFS